MWPGAAFRQRQGHARQEGRYVDLHAVEPSLRAREIASVAEKDPRIVEVILREAKEVVRCKGLFIVEYRLGFVMANAGVTNRMSSRRVASACFLLPMDPDGSAQALRESVGGTFGIDVGIVINDSFGRPWRNGVVGVAIGSAGLP